MNAKPDRISFTTQRCDTSAGMICKNAQLLKLFQDLKKRLDVERTEKRNSDNTAIKLLSEVEGMRQQARDLRKQETR